MKAFRALAVLFSIVIVALSSAHSQTSEGRILGTVYDQSGAVVAGAKVTVTNLATGVNRHLVTSGAGEYVAPNLEPGSYTVTAENGQGKLASSFTVVRLGANAAAARDPKKRPLLDKKEQLEQAIEKLKFEKAAMPAQAYKQQLTALLLELAKTQEALDQ